MQYIDLTHTFRKNMPVYPGDATSEFLQTSFLEKQGFNNFQIKTGMHVGTHMDAPFHMLQNGKRLSEYPPEHFFGKGHLVDARNQKFIDANILNKKKISKGDVILVITNFYKRFGTSEYYEAYPEITQSFASKAIELGVKMIGMDTPSPDRPPFIIHKLLLKNDILIIENLTNLEKLLNHPHFNIIALPAKFDLEAAPVRVIAQIE